jgi:hypothetical protein
MSHSAVIEFVQSSLRVSKRLRNPNAGRDAVKCSQVEVGVHKPTEVTPVAEKTTLNILSAHPMNHYCVNGY